MRKALAVILAMVCVSIGSLFAYATFFFIGFALVHPDGNGTLGPGGWLAVLLLVSMSVLSFVAAWFLLRSRPAEAASPTAEPGSSFVRKGNDTHCKKCGFELIGPGGPCRKCDDVKTRPCSSCGRHIILNDKTCPYCGADLK